MTFDLDAVIAEEAKGDTPDPFTFTFDGVEYTMPGRLDPRILSSIDDGRYDKAIRSLVGPEQWATIEASDKMLSIQTMDTLVSEWAKHCSGVALGKSGSSMRSSKRTATRSKRTSNGSTASASLKSVRKR